MVPESRIGKAISAESIREEVILSGEAYQKSLRKEIKGKQVCIKLDCCTRLDNNGRILFFFCKYYKRNETIKFTNSTLWMVPIYNPHGRD